MEQKWKVTCLSCQQNSFGAAQNYMHRNVTTSKLKNWVMVILSLVVVVVVDVISEEIN